MTLAGKVAVVTGVTSEIGQAIAARLASEGAAVAITGNTPAKVEAVAAELKKSGGKLRVAALDLSTPEVVERFFAETAQALGPVDILVNGAAWRRPHSFLETNYDDWRRTFAVCLDSYFLCSLAAARQMVPRRWGRIVHVGSIAGTVLMAPFSAYTVAKSAIQGLMTAMTCDLAPYGITVNCMPPGVVETRYTLTNLKPNQLQRRLDRIPMGRLARPEDCAAAVAHLVSPDMGYITGQTVYVDGGFLNVGSIAK